MDSSESIGSIESGELNNLESLFSITIDNQTALGNHEVYLSINCNDGIYRSLELNKNNIKLPADLSEDIKKHITIWHCTGGQYTIFNILK